MPAILFLTHDLEYHGYARQASLLAAALPRQRFAVSCFSMCGDGPFSVPFREANLPIHGRSAQRLFDFETPLALRALLRNQPALIHVWGLRALRLLRWATLMQRAALPPTFVTLNAGELRTISASDRRLFRRIAACTVSSKAERIAAICSDLPSERVYFIPPGVPLIASAGESDFRATLGLKADDLLLVTVGHFNSMDRFIDVLWAYEIVRGVDPSLHLAFIGDGPFRDRLSRSAHYISQPGLGVHYLNPRPDAAALLAHADVVLVGHRKSGGLYGVLEGMAAARPVIASRLPHLQDFIKDGENGLLVPTAVAPAYSRAIRRLAADAGLRKRLGRAARSHVETNHRVDEMAARFRRVIRTIHPLISRVAWDS